MRTLILNFVVAVLDTEDLFSRLSIEINSTWEPLMKKKKEKLKKGFNRSLHDAVKPDKQQFYQQGGWVSSFKFYIGFKR